MNISIWKKTIALSVSFLCMPAFTDPSQMAMNASDLEQSLAISQDDSCEKYLTVIKNQFSRVDQNLQDLALSVNNDRIASTKSKRSLIEEIVNLRQIIDQIQKDPFINIDATLNIRLIKLLDDMVHHIQKSVSAGFTTLEHYDTNTCFDRIFSGDVATSNIDTEIAQLQKNIETLENSSREIGLTWYNKAYRKVDQYIIDPCLKYNVVSRTGKILGASFLAWYFLWFRTERGTKPEDQLPFLETTITNKINADIPEDAQKEWSQTKKDWYKKYIANSDNNRQYGIRKEWSEALMQEKWMTSQRAKATKSMPNDYYEWEYWLREKVGAYAHMGLTDLNTLPDGFHFDKHNPIGIIGSVEKQLWQFYHNHMPIATLATPFIAPLLKTEADKAYGKISEKITEIHNRLKGGVYSQKAHADATRMEPKITFDDIIGLEHAKEELSIILRFFEDPDRWIRDGLKINSGFLFTGPTRTGKSHLAEALCGEIRKILSRQNRNPDEFGFYVINSAFIKKEGIANIMALARAQAPCVLFIDEIDLLRLQRVSDSDLLSEFLTSLSGTLNNHDPKKQVFILAATNKPQNMDFALKQPGRFGKEIRFFYPTFNERKKFFIQRLSDLAVNIDALNIDKLVYETAGASYENLADLIVTAFQKAKMFRRALDQSLLEEALDSAIRCIRIEGAKSYRNEERQIIAAHQAGHALATMLLPTIHKVAKVTLLPVQSKLEEEMIWEKVKKEDEQAPIEHGKMFTYSMHDTMGVATRQDKLNICKVHLAGHIAEELLLGECGYSYHNDDCGKGNSDSDKAMPFALSIAGCGKRIDDKTSREQRGRIEADAFKLIEQCKQEIRKLFEEHKEILRTIAQQLQERMTLSGDEIQAIITAGKTHTKQS